MLPLNKDTMMMIALIAVIIASVYLYRELQMTKKDLSAIRTRPQVVFTPPAPPPQTQQRSRPVVTFAESDSDEIKPDNTVADEQ